MVKSSFTDKFKVQHRFFKQFQIVCFVLVFRVELVSNFLRNFKNSSHDRGSQNILSPILHFILVKNLFYILLYELYYLSWTPINDQLRPPSSCPVRPYLNSFGRVAAIDRLFLFFVIWN